MTDIQANESYRVALPEFEGPLDLLLHLCKTHEIEIVNIPISFITEKYLEYLDVMQTLSVDVAADYLLMAATLAYLKSRELVPAPEPLEATEEEGEESALDPREELIRRLLEYQKYKNAAAQLGERPIEGRNIFGRGMEVEGDGGPAPLADHSVWKLIEAFGRLIEKAGPKVTHNVLFDRVSISARINQMIDKLEAKSGAFRFDELFDLNMPEPELRSQLVVTLLAILELARLKVIRVLASEDAETLFIAQVEGAALQAARRAKVSSDAEGVRESEEAEAGDEQAGTSGDAVAAEPSLQEIAMAEAAFAVEPPDATEESDALDMAIEPAWPGAEPSLADGGTAPGESVLAEAPEGALLAAEAPAGEGEAQAALADPLAFESEPALVAEQPEDGAMPEDEPRPEDASLPESEPDPDASVPESPPAGEDERLPGSEIIPPGEPVTEGDVIPEGDPVPEGEVIPPGEVIPTEPAPEARPDSTAASAASVSPDEEIHEKA